MSPLESGGRTNILMKILAIPATELKKIDKKNEAPVNFGFLGFTLAHEMSHFFDKDGWNIRFLLQQLTDKTHAQKMQCIAKQYNNNTKTTDDDFADFSGLEIAYRALENKLGKRAMKMPVVEGHQFTNEQAFFISFAHNWCRKKEELGKNIGDVHSRGDLRILNPLKNSDTFAQAFNCPVGSPMNPVDKCRIWLPTPKNNPVPN